MSYLDQEERFPQQVVNSLKNLIEKKRSQQEVKETFINPILREDIFALLGRECIVVYYPLENEENDGFHIQIPVNGKKQHFVYINTEKPMPKQVYAAAHELGHIWTENGKAIEYSASTQEEEDALMNRFAAELLMPYEEFHTFAGKQLVKYQSEPGKISGDNFFRVVACLMDKYFVPFQAVVRRMGEVDLLKTETCEHIIVDLYKNNPNGEQLLNDCINEGGFPKLLEKSRKRSMTEFTDLLNRAAEEGIFREEKISYLRERLNIPKVEDSGNTITIGT